MLDAAPLLVAPAKVAVELQTILGGMVDCAMQQAGMGGSGGEGNKERVLRVSNMHTVSTCFDVCNQLTCECNVKTFWVHTTAMLFPDANSTLPLLLQATWRDFFRPLTRDIAYLLCMATGGLRSILLTQQTIQMESVCVTEMTAAKDMGDGVLAFLMKNDWDNVAALVNACLHKLSDALAMIEASQHPQLQQPALQAATAEGVQSVGPMEPADKGALEQGTSTEIQQQPSQKPQQGAKGVPEADVGTTVQDVSIIVPIDASRTAQLVKYTVWSALHGRFSDIRIEAAYRQWLQYKRAALNRSLVAILAVWGIACILSVAFRPGSQVKVCLLEVIALAMKLLPLALISLKDGRMTAHQRDALGLLGEILRIGFVATFKRTFMNDVVAHSQPGIHDGKVPMCFARVIGFPQVTRASLPQIILSWAGQVRLRCVAVAPAACSCMLAHVALKRANLTLMLYENSGTTDTGISPLLWYMQATMSDPLVCSKTYTTYQRPCVWMLMHAGTPHCQYNCCCPCRRHHWLSVYKLPWT